jgi:hypothetical protein
VKKYRQLAAKRFLGEHHYQGSIDRNLACLERPSESCGLVIGEGDVLVLMPETQPGVLGLTKKCILNRLEALGGQKQSLTEGDVIRIQPFGQLLVDGSLLHFSRTGVEFRVRTSSPVADDARDAAVDQTPEAVPVYDDGARDAAALETVEQVLTEVLGTKADGDALKVDSLSAKRHRGNGSSTCVPSACGSIGSLSTRAKASRD